MIEGCDYFLRTIANELQLKETLNKETISKLDAYNKELKNDLSKKTENLELKIRAAENEKAHLAAREQTLKEQLAETKKEKENLEKDWKERL